MLALWLSLPAFADRYWDLQEKDAAAIVKTLTPGTLVVTWCQQCGGDLRVLRVSSAKVAPGTYADDEGRKSVVMERAVLFAGTNPTAPTLPASAPCGGSPEDQVDPGDSSTGPSTTEHLDVPYSFVLDAKGRLSWIGASVAKDFGQITLSAPPLAADFLARVQACASSK